MTHEQSPEKRLTGSEVRKQFRDDLFAHFGDSPNYSDTSMFVDPLRYYIDGKSALTLILNALRQLKGADIEGENMQYHIQELSSFAAGRCNIHSDHPSEYTERSIASQLTGEIGALWIEQLASESPSQGDAVFSTRQAVRHDLGEGAAVINSQQADMSHKEH